SNSRLVQTITSGSFNLVHIIEFQDEPFRMVNPCAHHDHGQVWELAGRASRNRRSSSQVETMQYIRATTTIPVPVPEVYHFDTTADNEISAPYIAMACIPGRIMFSVWFDKGEERRLRILPQLAGFMFQL
ncbi:hypothetical protein C8F01DRAFT_968802, partial [Mycena amicta]